MSKTEKFFGEKAPVKSKKSSDAAKKRFWNADPDTRRRMLCAIAYKNGRKNDD